MSRPSQFGLASILVLAVAACGGSGSGSASPSAGGASASAATSPSAAASQDAGASASPGASGSASVAPSSGGTATTACDLISADEAVGILDVDSVTTASTTGDPSYCTYTAPDGNFVLATSYGTSGGTTTFGVFKGEAGATEVSGIGDGAVFSPSTNTFFILKGDAIMGITAGPAGMPGAERLELSKQLGAIAVARM